MRTKKSKMVCESCQSRLSKVIVPDKWKEGATNSSSSSSVAGKTNKALLKMKSQAQYVPTKSICRLCKTKIQHQMNYCNDCAHKKGMLQNLKCVI